MKKVLPFIGLAIMSFTACNNPAPAPEATAKDSTAAFDMAAVKTAITEGDKMFADAIMKGDSLAIANSYTSDAQLLPPNMPAVTTPQGIATMAAGFAKMGIKSFTLEATDVFGGPEMVIEQGKFTVGDGAGKTIDQGKSMVIWKQENGKWKMYRDMWSSDMPPPPPAKK